MLTTATRTQREALAWLFDPLAPDVLAWCGDIRSAKTFGMVLLLLVHSISRRDQFYILMGQSAASLERSVIPQFEKLAPMFGWDVTPHGKTSSIQVGPNKFVLAGAPNERAALPIPGMSAAGLGVDEATLIPKTNLQYALSRCDQPGRRVILTFNTDHPANWLYQDWILGKQVPHRYLEATIEDARDAGLITQDSIDFYKSTITGHLASRWLGRKWAAPTGLCVPSLLPGEVSGEAHTLTYAGVDYGISLPSAAAFFGLTESGTWESVDQYYHDTGGKTAADHAQGIIEKGQEQDPPCSLYVLDASANALRLELELRGANVVSAGRDVVQRINLTEGAFASGRMVATMDAVPMLLREAAAYRWDEKADKDAPIKKNDHMMDGCGYLAEWLFEPATAFIGEKPAGL